MLSQESSAIVANGATEIDRWTREGAVPEIPLSAQESLALLRDNASRLAAVTKGMKRSQLHAAPEVGFEESFRAFVGQREELLITLDALAPREWEHSATVMAYGQPNEKTVRFYASKLAKHERIHERQIERALTRE